MEEFPKDFTADHLRIKISDRRREKEKEDEKRRKQDALLPELRAKLCELAEDCISRLDSQFHLQLPAELSPESAYQLAKELRERFSSVQYKKKNDRIYYFANGVTTVADLNNCVCLYVDVGHC